MELIAERFFDALCLRVCAVEDGKVAVGCLPLGNGAVDDVI